LGVGAARTGRRRRPVRAERANARGTNWKKGTAMKCQSIKWVAILICIAIFMPACTASHEPNSVAKYLSHADRQYETNAQKLEIERALRDMLEMNSDQLKKQRYADYQGHAGAWPITTLLERYFLPVPPVVLETDRFYQDVSKSEARKAVKKQLSALEKSVPAH
jgi:hypothetical protein